MSPPHTGGEGAEPQMHANGHEEKGDRCSWFFVLGSWLLAPADGGSERWQVLGLLAPRGWTEEGTGGEGAEPRRDAKDHRADHTQTIHRPTRRKQNCFCSALSLGASPPNCGRLGGSTMLTRGFPIFQPSILPTLAVWGIPVPLALRCSVVGRNSVIKQGCAPFLQPSEQIDPARISGK
jgi:hypothetical protein